MTAFDANAHSLSSILLSHIVECDDNHVLDVVHPVVAVSPHCIPIEGCMLAPNSRDFPNQVHTPAFGANAHSLSPGVLSHTVDCDTHTA